MPKISLEVDVEIQNYAELVQEKSILASVFTDAPFLGELIRKRVDDELSKILTTELISRMPRILETELGTRQVRSRVKINSSMETRAKNRVI